MENISVYGKVKFIQFGFDSDNQLIGICFFDRLCYTNFYGWEILR